MVVRNNSQMQIIDANNFEPEFQAHVHKLGLERCGFKYSVVAVLGRQSSGKSTLLNSLFGTEFLEMDAHRGRYQTTKGFWAAKDVDGDTLVIDVQGTDPKDSIENCIAFEYRVALFSLAVADVLIVNMWFNDLNRYSPSNYGLLKALLTVNVNFFSEKERITKTTLLLVVRDYSAATIPLKNVETKLKNNLAAIWRDIKKPTPYRDSQFADFFNLVVFGMPSKITQAFAYETSVPELRKIWDSHKPGSYTRGIPADEFAQYVWQVLKFVKDCSELHIRSHEEISAAHRARLEVIAECMAELERLTNNAGTLDSQMSAKVGELEQYRGKLEKAKAEIEAECKNGRFYGGIF